MENAEALMGALFNAALITFIVAAMFAAGLSTTLSALGKVFRNIWLVVLVLLAAFVVRPLVGWGIAALMSLETPAYIAMLLLATCPGAPFGVDGDERPRRHSERRLAPGIAGNHWHLHFPYRCCVCHLIPWQEAARV